MKSAQVSSLVSLVLLCPISVQAGSTFQQAIHSDSSTVWLNTDECAVDVRNARVGLQFCAGQTFGSASKWPGEHKLQTVNLTNGDCGAAIYGDGYLRWYCARPAGIPKAVTEVVQEAPKPAIETVAKAPKPVDLDQDGVADAKDLCPDTPADTKVNPFGCDVAEAPVLQGVNFATNSWKLTEESKKTLDEVADKLRGQTARRIEIGGHTDSLGPALNNKRLSYLRAESVARYLIKRGLNPNYIEARGYGEDQPTASNKTRKGRSINRRVTIKLL